MAWIPCDDNLFDDPRTARLAYSMGWDTNRTVGAMLRFRCWCIKYAVDGDLRPFTHSDIAIAFGEPPAEGERIVSGLLESRWLEGKPYFRVSDWWELTGLFLRGRFKRQPDAWQRIERLYSSLEETGQSRHMVPAARASRLSGDSSVELTSSDNFILSELPGAAHVRGRNGS